MDISIVIPCYNYGEFINETITSIEQYDGPFELEIIIVNDGSTDMLTLEVLKDLETRGYNVINQKNQGLAVARNNGIKVAKSRYILPVDADNRIRPNYIDKGIEVLRTNKEVGIVYGDAQKFGDVNEHWIMPDFSTTLLLGDKNYIDACAVFRKEVWETVGGYFTDIPVMGVEDWVFWLQAFAKGWKFYHVNDVLFDYRVRSGSMITKVANDSKFFQLQKYIILMQMEVVKTLRADMVSDKEKKILLQERLEKLSLYQVYNDTLLNTLPNIINAYLNSMNKVVYTKDCLYWLKERIKKATYIK